MRPSLLTAGGRCYARRRKRDSSAGYPTQHVGGRCGRGGRAPAHPGRRQGWRGEGGDIVRREGIHLARCEHNKEGDAPVCSEVIARWARREVGRRGRTFSRCRFDARRRRGQYRQIGRGRKRARAAPPNAGARQIAAPKRQGRRPNGGGVQEFAISGIQ